MIQEKYRCRFMHIIKDLKSKRAEIFTLAELENFLGVSKRKLIDFENGKNFDFWLLCDYATILGEEVEFNLKN